MNSTTNVERPPMPHHYSDDDLELYALSRLGAREYAIEQHLQVCQACALRALAHARWSILVRGALQLAPLA